MYPLLSQEIARQHCEAMLHEAEVERQLARSYSKQYIQMPVPSYRFVLFLALLSTLIPLLGTTLGISQYILIGECLFCLVGLAFTMLKPQATRKSDC